MRIAFEITEDDLLIHQLFATANADIVRKRRGRGRLFLILIYLVAGVVIWKMSGPLVCGLFLLGCIPLYFLYIRMESKQYQKQIKALVKDQIRDRKSKVTTLHFEKNQVTMADGPTKSTIPLTEINTIFELDKLYSLKLNSGQSIVLPKHHDNPDNDTEAQLIKLADDQGIPFIEQLDWKWK